MPNKQCDKGNNWPPYNPIKAGFKLREIRITKNYVQHQDADSASNNQLNYFFHTTA
jgi:hypothetical protein